MKRVLEPELMDDEAQALAYASADFADSNARFVSHFVEQAGHDFEGCILDLGCGPGDIAVRLTRALPGASVHAVDGSAAMVRLARETAKAATDVSSRIAIVEGRIPEATLPREAYDAVVSNSLLHHLAEPETLWSAVQRYGRPGAPVVVMDLFRPADPHAALQIVDRYAERESGLLRRDFLASLHAAFELEEVRAQLLRAGLDVTLKTRVVTDRHLVVSGRLA